MILDAGLAARQAAKYLISPPKNSLFISSAFLRCANSCVPHRSQSTPLCNHKGRLLQYHVRAIDERRLITPAMPPKQATLGYVKPSQQTLGCIHVVFAPRQLSTDSNHDRKFFAHPNGTKSKAQQSTLAFKSPNDAKNPSLPNHNAVKEGEILKSEEDKNEASDSDREGLLHESTRLKGVHGLEPNFSARTGEEDRNSDTPDGVSESLRHDEGKCTRWVVPKSSALPLC